MGFAPQLSIYDLLGNNGGSRAPMQLNFPGDQGGGVPVITPDDQSGDTRPRITAPDTRPRRTGVVQADPAYQSPTIDDNSTPNMPGPETLAQPSRPRLVFPGEQPLDATGYRPGGVGGKSDVPTLDTDPNIPQTPTNRVWSGDPFPVAKNPDGTWQDRYAQMGRGASFKNGFLSGLSNGGIIGGIVGGISGALDKNSGRVAAYNADVHRWLNTKQAQLAIEREDPVLAHRLAVGQMGSEVPARDAQYQANQQAQLGTKTVLEDQRQGGRETLQGMKGDQAMDRLTERDASRLKELGLKTDAQTNKRFNERFNTLRNDSANDGVSDKDLESQASKYVQAQDDIKAANEKLKGALLQDRITTNQQRISQAGDRIRLAQGNLEARRAELEQKGQYQGQKMALDSAAKNLASVQREHTRLTNILTSQTTSPEDKAVARQQLEETESDIKDLQDQVAGKGGSGSPFSHRPKQGAPPANPYQDKVGKSFTGPDGQKYVADEIDAQGNITKRHRQ